MVSVVVIGGKLLVWVILMIMGSIMLVVVVLLVVLVRKIISSIVVVRSFVGCWVMGFVKLSMLWLIVLVRLVLKVSLFRVKLLLSSSRVF